MCEEISFMVKDMVDQNINSEEQSEVHEVAESRIKIGDKTESIEDISPKKALKELKSVFKDYEDYITVPNRRKTDSVYRNYISDYVYIVNDMMKEIHALLIEKQQMSTWAIAERLINEFGSFAKEVMKGDYGFTTFFDNPKLLEMDISQLYIIDYDLIRVLKTMKERTNAFMKMVQLNYLEDIDLWFETLDRIIGRTIRLHEDRTKLIGSYERISY